MPAFLYLAEYEGGIFRVGRSKSSTVNLHRITPFQGQRPHRIVGAWRCVNGPLSGIGSCYFALAAKVCTPHVVTNLCEGRIGHYGLFPDIRREERKRRLCGQTGPSLRSTKLVLPVHSRHFPVSDTPRCCVKSRRLCTAQHFESGNDR